MSGFAEVIDDLSRLNKTRILGGTRRPAHAEIGEFVTMADCRPKRPYFCRDLSRKNCELTASNEYGCQRDPDLSAMPTPNGQPKACEIRSKPADRFLHFARFDTRW